MTNKSYVKQIVDIHKVLLIGHKQGDDLTPVYNVPLPSQGWSWQLPRACVTCDRDTFQYHNGSSSSSGFGMPRDALSRAASMVFRMSSGSLQMRWRVWVPEPQVWLHSLHSPHSSQSS